MTLWHLLAVTLDLLAIALVVIAGVSRAGHDETDMTNEEFDRIMANATPALVWYPAVTTGTDAYTGTWVGFTLSG